MQTRERASLRETTVVLVRKMWRRIRSAREGREGDQSRDGRMIRVWRRRRAWRIGARDSVRNWWEVWYEVSCLSFGMVSCPSRATGCAVGIYVVVQLKEMKLD
jgi:hypothetical protein